MLISDLMSGNLVVGKTRIAVSCVTVQVANTLP